MHTQIRWCSLKMRSSGNTGLTQKPSAATKTRNHFWTGKGFPSLPFCMPCTEAISCGRVKKTKQQQQGKLFVVTLSLFKEENRNVEQEQVCVFEKVKNIQWCLM